MKMIPTGDIRLLDGELRRREHTNREYMLRLRSRNLTMNYTLEAGLGGGDAEPHGGWEHPSCQLRGHFLGHWLSAAAMRYAACGDAEIKARADEIVARLAACQAENGGEWVASIPEKYFDWIARGKAVWAPHYTVHKTFMGLLDMYEMAGNAQALDVARKFARWFHRWTAQFTRDQMDDILDYETGGMLEVWAQLYSITGEAMYRELMDRYWRGRLFDKLLAGDDPLTNMHANTTIPEVMGCVRAYEATGEDKYRRVAKAYWRCAVTERGCYATGGQTCGEIWTPKGEMSMRLGEKNQEHCTVYNMMRLADALLRWTGEAQYADYIERNLYNGVFAQTYWQGILTNGMRSEYPLTGLLTYFLPLMGGAHKGWATETQDFFCCHGTLVQANAALASYMAYQDEDAINLCQYFDADIKARIGDADVTLAMREDTLAGSTQGFSVNSARQTLGDRALCEHRPDFLLERVTVHTGAPITFTLKLRLPEWRMGEPELYVNNERIAITAEKGFAAIRREWHDGDIVEIMIPRGLHCEPLPDEPDTVAFLYGPIVLAGICNEERTLYAADPEHPEQLLKPDNEREWGNWKTTFRTLGQHRGIRFIPLNQVGYEGYSVYFPIEKKR